MLFKATVHMVEKDSIISEKTLTSDATFATAFKGILKARTLEEYIVNMTVE